MTYLSQTEVATAGKERPWWAGWGLIRTVTGSGVSAVIDRLVRPSDPPSLPADPAVPGLEAGVPTAESPWISLRMASPWAAMVVSSILIICAYSRAATSPANDQLHFHLFWTGVVVAFAAMTFTLISTRATAAERLVLLVGLALFCSLPKYLRDPGGPIFHDELGHWAEANAIHVSGRLFQTNPTVPIAQFYPGLHSLTAAIAYLGGLSTWQSAVILLLVLHVLAVLGVYLLALNLFRRERIACLAGLLYTLNPSFMYFHTQYAYESLGIVLFIWLAYFAVRLDQSVPGQDRLRWLSCGVLCAAALVVTHPLSTYIALSLLVVLAARGIVLRWRGPGTLSVFGLAAVLLTFGLTWTILVAPGTFAYLSPYLPRGMAEITRILHHHQQARHLFQHSPSPLYERAAAYVTPVLVFVGILVGFRYLHASRNIRPQMWGLAAFGLAYFLAFPFILTEAGNEGARRSWSFMFLGISLLLAGAGAAWLRLRAPLRRRVLAVGTVCVLLTGGVTMHINANYRFPGPVEFGSDTRSITDEVLAMGAWFRQNEGANRHIATDRYVGMVVGAFDGERPAAPAVTFPLWELFFDVPLPGARLIYELRTSRYDYMVIDRRMYRLLPPDGLYFAPDEPRAFQRSSPPPLGAMAKYSRLPFTTRIYSSTNYSIYRLDFSHIGLRWSTPVHRPRTRVSRRQASTARGLP